jgi:hypothetical protein
MSSTQETPQTALLLASGNQEARFDRNVDAARQAEEAATGIAPTKNEINGSSREVVGGLALADHLDGSIMNAPQVEISKSSDGDTATYANVTLATEDGATNYSSARRDYDYRELPRDETRITKMDNDGNVITERVSLSPKLALQTGIIAGRQIEKGFTDPDAEGPKLAALPEQNIDFATALGGSHSDPVQK